METGDIYLPAHAPDLADLVNELVAFPHGTLDDFVDVLAYAVLYATRPAIDYAELYGIWHCQHCTRGYVLNHQTGRRPCPYCGTQPPDDQAHRWTPSRPEPNTLG